MQFRADTEVAELGTKAVPAGWCLGWGSNPTAVPILPAAPGDPWEALPGVLGLWAALAAGIQPQLQERGRARP